MSDIDRLLDNLQEKVEQAKEEKVALETEREAAIEAQKKAEEGLEENKKKADDLEEVQRLVNDAKQKEQEAEEAYARVTGDDTKTSTNNGKNGGFTIGLVSGILVAAITAGFVYAITRESKTGSIVSTTDTKDNNKIEGYDTTVTGSNGKDEYLTYDSKTNSAVVVSGIHEQLKNTYFELSTDVFENLVADYSNKYSNQYDGKITNVDLVKFALIANIDRIAEDNPELISELANGAMKEEYLNDAAKVIGASVMNNFTVWNETNSTEDFIRVSDIIFGEQKEKMLLIEDYTDRIAEAANKEDADLVNSIVAEFINELNSGKLSKLDDGVGFAAQVNIAVIADGIARNYLNQENFDMFQILKTSEKYVSNIFAVYERCNVDTKTLSR